MWTLFIQKIFSVIMPIVIFFNGITFTVPHKGNDYPVDIEYSFTNETPGSAAGTVTLEAKLGGNYKLYWGDEDGSKLYETVDSYKVYYSELAEIKVKDGEGSAEILPFTAIPDGAETVLAFKGDICCGVEDIAEEKQANNGELMYNFGAISDVHFNRESFPVKDNSVLTFSNALNFLDKVGVSLVGMSGDISRNCEKDSYIKFNNIAAEYDFPVYTCTGNHDAREGYDKNNWYDYMNVGVYGDVKRPGVEAVNRETLDFVYAPDNAKGDVFIFFSHTSDDFSPEGQNVTPEQLEWLGEQLEKYKDRTVYLFFHSFIPDDSGNPFMCEGNILGPKREYYSSFPLKDDRRYEDGKFREYLQKYKNVVFFNGHSHLSFDMQKYNPNLNITNYDGKYATFVHIPGVSVTRTIGGEEGKLKDKGHLTGSQGYLAKVYENRIVLTGVDFTKGEFVSYATFNIDR